jgi:1-acyl-sn-glycerol-3-phosphate acyltransferase
MLIRRLAQLILRGYFRLRVVGLDHLPSDGPIVMIMLSRPSSFLAKSELYKGLLKPILEFARQIPIHRGTPDRAGLQAGLRVLAGGGVLGVFPEGTRGSGELATIQHGIGYLALHGRCPIVPVVCKGTSDALPKGKAVPRFRAPIEVVFGAPFTLDVPGDPRTRAAVASAAEQVRGHLLDHLAAVTNASADSL